MTLPERNWLEPYESKTGELLEGEQVNLLYMAVTALQDMGAADKCGCNNCKKTAEASFARWEREKDRVDGAYHTDHEEDRLYKLANRRLKYGRK